MGNFLLGTSAHCISPCAVHTWEVGVLRLLSADANDGMSHF